MKEDEEGTVWMHTGDEAIMDEEGYLKSESFFPWALTCCSCLICKHCAVVGRIKDIIIRGGEVSEANPPSYSLQFILIIKTESLPSPD